MALISNLEWSFLGRVPYATAWRLQEEIRSQILNEQSSHKLLLIEHPPTLTLGRAENGSNLSYDMDEIRRMGFEVFQTNRGGKVTYHGPGQLVAYPIVDLRDFKMGIKEYVCKLEQTMIHTLSSVGLQATRKEGFPGVWVKNRKVGSVGIHVRKSVSIHGLALNINPNLHHFSLITPCGIEGVHMTSMAAEGIPISLNQALVPFLEAFTEVFDVQLRAIPQNSIDLFGSSIESRLTATV